MRQVLCHCIAHLSIEQAIVRRFLVAASQRLEAEESQDDATGDE